MVALQNATPVEMANAALLAAKAEAAAREAEADSTTALQAACKAYGEATHKIGQEVAH